MATYKFEIEAEFDGEFETGEQERPACVAIEDALGGAEFPESQFGWTTPTSFIALHPRRIR